MAVATLGSVPVPLLVPSTVFVPGGRFPIAAWSEEWTNEAEVRPLRIGRMPVSNAEYAAFVAADRVSAPPWWRDQDFSEPEQPVVGVTWFEAFAYCQWLRETLGGRWRLPTEAEWEHAACADPRRATQRPPLREAGRPPRLGQGDAGSFGLLDVGTIVHEWCQDWFAPGLVPVTRRYDPRGPEIGETRVRRGGSWRRASGAAWRDGLDPSARAVESGFRVVREVP